MKQNRNSGGNRRGGGNQGNSSTAGQQAGASTRQMVAQLYEMLLLERPSGQELSFLGFMQEMHRMFGVAQIRPLYTAIAQAWLDNGYQPANFEMVWTILYDKYRMISKIQALGSALPASTIEAEPVTPQFVPASPVESKPNAPMPQTDKEVSEPAEPQPQPKEQTQAVKEAQPKNAGQNKDKERKNAVQPQQGQGTKDRDQERGDRALANKEAETTRPAKQEEAMPQVAKSESPADNKEDKADTPPATDANSPKSEAEGQETASEPSQEPKEIALPRSGTRFREWCYMGKSSRSEILMRTGLPIFSKGIGESYLALYQRVFGEALPENNGGEPITAEQAQRYAARVSILVNYVQDLFASITKGDQPERYIIRSANGEWLAFNSCLRGADGKEIFFVLSRNNFKASFPVAPWEVKEFASAATLLIEFTRRPSGVLDGIYSADDLDKLTDLVVSGGQGAGEQTPSKEVADEEPSPAVLPQTDESVADGSEKVAEESATLFDGAQEAAPLSASEDSHPETTPQAQSSAEEATASIEVGDSPSPEQEASPETEAQSDVQEAKPKRTSRGKSASSSSKSKATTASKSKPTAKKSASSTAKKSSAKASPTPSDGAEDQSK